MGALASFRKRTDDPTQGGIALAQTKTKHRSRIPMTLVLETSSYVGSVAVGDGGRAIETREFEGARHSVALFEVLRELRISSLAIQTVIVGVGPGSFSSIRVAVAAAQAIAFSKRARLLSVCSARSLALQFGEVARLGVFSDARRGELYGTLFSFGRMVRPTFVFAKEELPALTRELDLALSSEDLGPGLRRAHPRAEDLIRLEGEQSVFSEEPFPEPIYLRGPLKRTAGTEIHLS